MCISEPTSDSLQFLKAKKHLVDVNLLMVKRQLFSHAILFSAWTMLTIFEWKERYIMSINTENQKKSLDHCDLVMVGGIASGIVYPAAIVKLKDNYRFRNIGGTSAGAIAASATAAAEYYRQTVGSPTQQEEDKHGFAALGKLSTRFSEKDFLLQLFQAPPDIQPLLKTLIALVTPGDVTASDNTALEDDYGFINIFARTLPTPVLRFVRSNLPLLQSNNPTVFAQGEQIGARRGILVGLILALPLPFVALGIASLFLQMTRVQTFQIFIEGLIIFLLLGVLLGCYYGAKLGGPLQSLFNLLQIALVKVPGRKRGVEPGNYYGLCTGHAAEAANRSPAADALTPSPLTDWLHATFNNLAGLQDPQDVLTFRMLKHPSGQVRYPHAIALQMVTTNLSHSQPYTLPDDLNGFIFNEDDMNAFFPVEVVQHLKCNASPDQQIPVSVNTTARIGTLSISSSQLPDGFYFLPQPDDLPVVFATRMSLSFPILLSAVPLYTINYEVVDRLYNNQENKTQQKLTESDLQVNWFSDGGISSNFPIHFFDKWLPKCPTFGINFTSMPTTSFAPSASSSSSTQAQLIRKSALTALPIKAKSEQAAVLQAPLTTAGASSENMIKDVYLPRAGDILRPDWKDIPEKDYIRFFSAIFTTGMSYRDAMQSQLPSYSDRIVQIRFKDDEGGLNLNMTPQMIEGLIRKGSDAGEALQGFDFEIHRWVRFQILMALLQQNLESMKAALGADEDVSQLLTPRTFPYGRSKDWCQEAQNRIECLQKMIHEWQVADEQWPHPPLFDFNALESPSMILRVTPEL